jgi:hypothetical protein
MYLLSPSLIYESVKRKHTVEFLKFLLPPRVTTACTHDVNILNDDENTSSYFICSHGCYRYMHA